MKIFWILPRLLLSKAEASPTNDFLQVGWTFSFETICKNHFFIIFWASSLNNTVLCGKTQIVGSGIHGLRILLQGLIFQWIATVSYTVEHKPYSTDFPQAPEMKEKFSITSFMDLLLDSGVDYSSERVRCRKIGTHSSVVCWEQVDREQMGYAG